MQIRANCIHPNNNNNPKTRRLFLDSACGCCKNSGHRKYVCYFMEIIFVFTAAAGAVKEHPASFFVVAVDFLTVSFYSFREHLCVCVCARPFACSSLGMLCVLMICLCVFPLFSFKYMILSPLSFEAAAVFKKPPFFLVFLNGVSRY